MPFAAILIGAIIIIAALNGTHGNLATALEADLPGYFVWAVAIAAILGLGFIPGLRLPSRMLLALVLVVIVLGNWSKIVSGFSAFAKSGASTAAAAGAGSPAPSSPAGAGQILSQDINQILSNPFTLVVGLGGGL